MKRPKRKTIVKKRFDEFLTKYCEIKFGEAVLFITAYAKFISILDGYERKSWTQAAFYHYLPDYCYVTKYKNGAFYITNLRLIHN